MTYGIGSGEHRTLKEYVCTIRDMINPKLPLGIGELQKQSGGGRNLIKQTPSSCINIEKLTEDTGWMPKVSFEEGIRRTIRYYRELRNEAKV